MSNFNCPNCGHLIGTLTNFESTEPALDRAHVDTFMTQRTIRRAQLRSTAASLRREYVAWCGMSIRPLSAKAFGMALAERGVRRARTQSERVYVGIGLL